MIKVLVLGDSNSMIFDRRLCKPLRLFFLGNVDFKTISVHGATISGIENPNSKTQAKNLFEKGLKENTNCRYCIVHLGEIDMGFVLWHQSEKKDIDIEILFQKTLAKMYTLIEKIAGYGYVPIIISAPLPTIQDGIKWGTIANLRKSIRTNQRQRTDLTVRFNHKVSLYCQKKGHININLDKMSISKKGIVRTYLRNINKKDHHYNPITYSILLFYFLRRNLTP